MSDRRWRLDTAALLAPLSLIVLILVLFGPSLSHQLVWDDQDNIVENPALRQPLFSGFSGGALASPAAPTRFLANLSFAVEYRLWELKPLGYHAVNLLLHLINTLLVYLLVLRIVARWRWEVALVAAPPRSGRPAAWIAGWLFAVHPVHVETVNSIALGRGYLLATAFGLAACCLVAAEHWRPWRWGGLAVALAGSALSHELGLSALALVVIVWFLRRRLARRKVVSGGIETAGLVLAGASLAALLVWAVIGIGREAGMPTTALPAAMLAIKQLIAPVPLCLWYDVGAVDGHWGHWAVAPLSVAAVVFIGGLLGVTAWLRDARAVWCLVLFGVSLMPVLIRHLLPFPLPSLLGERWLYWPSAFLTVWIGVLIQAVWAKWAIWDGAGREQGRRTAPGWVAVGLGCVAAAGGTFYTAAQIDIWRDNIALFEHAVRACPPSAYLRSALGKHYFDHNQIARAKEEFTAAMAINPDFPRARIGMGLVDLANDDLPAALRDFSLARTLAPSDANVYNGLGEVYFRVGQYERALAQFQRAAALNQANATYVWNLALTLMKAGRYTDAIAAWERVLAVSPDPNERATAREEIKLLLLQQQPDPALRGRRTPVSPAAFPGTRSIP